MMSTTDWAQPPRLSDAPREYIVSVELFVTNSTGHTFRKPPKKTDKSSLRMAAGSSDESGKKVKERGSKASLSRGMNGHWRPGVCKLTESEDGERCLLNLYLEQSILYQTVSVHLLNHTDIRIADSSLHGRNDCLSIYSAAGQRWTSANSSEPLYVQFPGTNACNAWLVLLRSYAIAEIYGRFVMTTEGGLYRIWRQIELDVIQGRNLGNAKVIVDGLPNVSLSEPEGDAVDLDVCCDIRVNDILCGRTTVKKGIGSPDWHEKFVFPDLPPFEALEVNVCREKKLLKSVVMGSVRIILGNFRRGETVEGWFPILQNGPVANGLQVGELRMKLRVDEEIILPRSAYAGMIKCLHSRNFLRWMSDFENKLQLKTISHQLISIAVAKNILIDHVFEYANQEVDGTPQAHNTLFRGNTILTKTMELCMAWYGKVFLDASIGSVIRRICSEKVSIEVDPVRSGKNPKDVERNVEQLILWCKELWQQIYSVRGECPPEMRRLFQHIRQLVEQRSQIKDTNHDSNRELPRQSVSAFCFLRFIVPAILHPHLFGLYAGLPDQAVQRSLTLIAKVIQSLANLTSTSAHKEDYMRGVKQFIKESSPAMTDYILTVSTPVPEARGPPPRPEDSQYDRSNIVTSLLERKGAMSLLDQESIPLLPHVLDISRQLAIIGAAVIRNSKSYSHKPKPGGPQGRDDLDNFCAECFQVEEEALHRVGQLATRSQMAKRASVVDVPMSPQTSVPPSPVNGYTMTTRTRKSSGSDASTASRRRKLQKPRRPSTAPSDGDARSPSRETPFVASVPPSPVHIGSPRPLHSRRSHSEFNGSRRDTSSGASVERSQGVGYTSKPARQNAPQPQPSLSADSIHYQSQEAVLPTPTLSRNQSAAASVTGDPAFSEDGVKRKKGLLRGILARK